MLINKLVEMGHNVSMIPLRHMEGTGPAYCEMMKETNAKMKDLKVDVLVQDELCHSSLFLANELYQGTIGYRIVSLVHNLSCCIAADAEERERAAVIEKRYLSSVDACICVSEAVRRSVNGLKIQIPLSAVVHPGSDRLGFAPEDRPLPDGTFTVVFAAEVSPIKGLDVLIDALEMSGCRYDLQIAGQISDTEYYEGIIRRISMIPMHGRIKFHGHLNADALTKVMQQGHVLAIPSRYEGYGIALAEAMGQGLPVIAAKRGGASEMITNGKNGFLVDYGDTEGVMMALQTLMQDRDTLLEMSHSARERFKELPTWDESMERAVDFLGSVL
jgi:glycosyltransferase involved in cell wall biosynthesis